MKLGRDNLTTKSQRLRATLTILALAFVCIALGVKSLNAQVEQDVSVTIEPDYYIVQEVGVTFSINVTIRNVQNLYGWELKLYYPNNILNGTSAVEGYFLKQDSVQTFFGVKEFNDNYNQTHGRIWAYCTRIGNVSGIDGSGTLISITFRSKATDGPEKLTLDDVKLSDPGANKIECTILNGQIKVVPEFPVPEMLFFIMPLTAILLGLRYARKKGSE